MVKRSRERNIGVAKDSPSTVYLAASVGGHLELLEALAPALTGHSVVWITTPGARPDALRQRGEDLHVLPPLDRKAFSFRGVVLGILLAIRLKPAVVITSGAGVVASFCLTARLMGARLMFVETMARVSHGSVTGRLLAPLADRVLIQWPELQDQYPSATVCRPLLLEALPPIGGTPGHGTFVSVGSHPQPFSRFLTAVARAAEAGTLPRPLIAQVGVGQLGFLADETFEYMSPSDFLRAVSSAAVVVCHGGAGVIATVLRHGRRPIVMARRTELGEHVDDHQRQLLAKLSKIGLIVELTNDLTDDVVASSFSAENEPDLSFSSLPSVLGEVRHWLAASGRVSRQLPGDIGSNRIAALAWGAHTQRAEELAQAVGGESRSFGNLGLHGRGSAPVRWAINSGRTIVYLARRRPKAVIVQNPPIFLGVIALAYCKMASASLVLDSHPTSFGRKGTRFWRALLPIHRAIARRSAGVLVTEDQLRDEVISWGATALVVHEAPQLSDLAAMEGRHVIDEPDGKLRVLLVAVFAPDEPVVEAVAAALQVPDVRMFITGRLDRAPAGLVDRASPEVTFTGFLEGPDYGQALADCDVVMALTTESTSVMRAAYEAVYAGKPLIVSDWPILRETFPSAVHVENTSAAIAEALRISANELKSLRDRTADALEIQTARWRQQRSALVDLLAGKP